MRVNIKPFFRARICIKSLVSVSGPLWELSRQQLCNDPCVILNALCCCLLLFPICSRYTWSKAKIFYLSIIGMNLLCLGRKTLCVWGTLFFSKLNLYGFHWILYNYSLNAAFNSFFTCLCVTAAIVLCCDNSSRQSCWFIPLASTEGHFISLHTIRRAFL